MAENKGHKNLIPEAHKLTVAEQSAGGKKSVEARRAKKELKAVLEDLLERNYTDAEGNSLSGAEAICVKLFSQALKGDKRAFELVRDTVGQKPVERVLVADVDQSIIDDVEQMVSEYKDDDEGTGG